MAEVKITALPAYADPASTDVLPIVDVVADLTKKVSIDSLLKNAPTGSASAPSFAFDLDGNTGMYRSGADALAFSTGGTGRLFIDSSGRVVIGATSSPVQFSVQNASASQGLEFDTASGFASGPTLRGYYRPGSAYKNLGITGAQVVFGINDVEKVRIDSSGNVGIGTPSPAYKLHLAGTGDVQTKTSNGTAAIRFGITSGNEGIINLETGHDLTLHTNNTERMRIDSSGRVGIGTSSPARALVVSDAGAEGFEFYPGSSDTGNTLNHYDRGGAGAFIDITTNADQHIFGRPDGEKVRIDSSGRLLVGVSSTYANSGADDLQVGNNSSSTVTGISLGSTVESSIRFADASNASAGIIEYAHASDSMRLYTSAAERMRIDSSGNVGVGGAGTNGKFYVSGSGSSGVLDQTFYMDAGGSFPVQIALANGYGAKQGITFLNNGSSSYTSFGIVSENTGLSFKTAAYNVGNSSDLATGWSEAMRIDSSGRLLVGTSTATDYGGTGGYIPSIQFRGTSTATSSLAVAHSDGPSYIALVNESGGSVVSSGDSLGVLNFKGYDGNTYPDFASIKAQVDGTPGDQDCPGRLVFSTTADGASSPTERMRIYSTGEFHVGSVNTPSGYHRFVADSTVDNYGALQVDNVDTAAAACVASFVTATNSSATSNVLIKFGMNSYASGQGQINANGAGEAAFGTFSDRRLKENIVDLPSQWKNIKDLRPREFDFIESAGGEHQIGFVAQEMQAIYPDAVASSPMFTGENELSTEERLTITGWGKTHAYLVKALQEAMERIETLEQRLTDAGL
jgi:hypothetical protein